MRRKMDDKAMTIVASLGVVVALLVGVAIGVLVFYEINDNISMPKAFSATLSPGSTGARAAWNTTNSTAGTTWTLMPIIAIVIIAGIVLFVVTRFGQGMPPT